MTQARGRAVAGALALTAASAVWTLAGAAPASAYVCELGIDGPVAGSISAAPSLHITGAFVARQGIADRTVEVTFPQSPGTAPAGVTLTVAAVGPADRFDVPVGPLSRNGRYTVRVRARHDGMAALLNCSNGVGATQRDVVRTAEVSFAVSVRALPPGNVAARFDAADRRAVLSWSTSADPDVAGYTISRAVGGDPPTVVQVPPEPQSWTDANLPSGAATITYTLAASRNGPDPGKTSLPSPPVAVRLEIPAAAAQPPPTSARSSGTSAPTTVPFVLGLPVGGSAPETSVPAGPAGVTPAAPDDGAAQPPPYQPGDVGDGSASGGDPAVVGGASDGGGGPPQLAFVAAGVLSTVVAAQVLWLRRQSRRPALAGPSGPPDPLEPVEPAVPRSGADPGPPGPDTDVFAPPAELAAVQRSLGGRGSGGALGGGSATGRRCRNGRPAGLRGWERRRRADDRGGCRIGRGRRPVRGGDGRRPRPRDGGHADRWRRRGRRRPGPPADGGRSRDRGRAGPG